MDERLARLMTEGRLFLGIEFGSTRIKAVLIDDGHRPVAQGNFDWENRLEEGLWTYHQDEIISGLQASFRAVAEDFYRQSGVALKILGGLGISAMMHGYLPFDEADKPLVPFRTWRNTNTAKASAALSAALRFNMPQRWSASHLYQAVLNGEAHVNRIRFMTTLAGYVHFLLTGQKVIGIGDASGMFPIDSLTMNYDSERLKQFNQLPEIRALNLDLGTLLPAVRLAGQDAGCLSESGARLLDPSGVLLPGVPLCPPEGDAGTGMTATDAVRVRTGNVSAGTSIFAMVVLEHALKNVYEEIDMVTTPDGLPVAMVHCNNGSSDLDAWINLLGEAGQALGARFDKLELYRVLYNAALEGELSGGNLLSFNYLSGEPVSSTIEGRPLFVRQPDSRLTLSAFMRSALYGMLATLSLGMRLLSDEQVEITELQGHGGIFKTERVAQTLMASALDVPVAVSSEAGEGGAWGIAILSAYRVLRETDEGLADYLATRVFHETSRTVVQPDWRFREDFARYINEYQKVLPVERLAESSWKVDKA